MSTQTTAVVTGAGRGFGRAIAASLVAGEHTVVGIARSSAELDAVREDLGPRFVPVAADATDDALAESVLRVRGHRGRPVRSPRRPGPDPDRRPDRPDHGVQRRHPGPAVRREDFATAPDVVSWACSSCSFTRGLDGAREQA